MASSKYTSGERVPPGEYTSTAHAGATSCHLPPRQISAPTGRVVLPKCRCGGTLVWQAAPGGHP